MGLYSHVRIEAPLPDEDGIPKPPAGAVFQSKDLTDTPMLETWRITPEGKLVEETERWEEVPPEERPYPDAGGLLGLTGSLRTVKTGDQVHDDFHGDIRLIYRDDHTGATWFYAARFTDGELTRIRCTRYDPPKVAA